MVWRSERFVEYTIVQAWVQFHRVASAENIAWQFSAKQKLVGYQSQIVLVTWNFGWYSYSSKHNIVVLSEFVCLSSSMKVGYGPKPTLQVLFNVHWQLLVFYLQIFPYLLPEMLQYFLDGPHVFGWYIFLNQFTKGLVLHHWVQHLASIKPSKSQAKSENMMKIRNSLLKL